MKTTITNSALRIFLILAILCCFSKIQAFDFEIDYDSYFIQYSFTSDSTVEVSGHFPRNYWGNYVFVSAYSSSYDIDIPSYITYDNEIYKVTSIGDDAFCINDNFEYYNKYSFSLTIPETISSIGVNAIGGEYSLINIICLAKTPPITYNSYKLDPDGTINLFVLADSFDLYKAQNDLHHVFSSINITNGERSEIPHFAVDYLTQDLSRISSDLYITYGFNLNLISNDSSTNYIKAMGHYGDEGWDERSNYSYTNEESCEYRYNQYMIEAYTIEEGKSPSYFNHYYAAGCEGEYGFKREWYEYYDFIESDICYNISNDCVYVTQESYMDPCNPSYDCFGHYSGDIVIPSIANFFHVVSIGWGAFMDCEQLISVNLPASIVSIEAHAFGNCPNLTFIKCMGTTPPNASDISFDDGVYQNTTLYVPMDAVDAYRNATGWKNFQSIVGFYDYDFEVDGLKYAITSDSTVTVKQYHFMHEDWDYWFCEYLDSPLIIEVPSNVTYNNREYTVTAIGDWAFYNEFNPIGGDGDYSVYLYYNITIPKTITSIGYKAFGGEGIDLINVFCFPNTPPTMNDSFCCCGDVNLFVPSDAYYLYEEMNQNNHFFTSIEATNGESSSPPTYNEEYLYQPLQYGPYGCAVKIYRSESSIIYSREINNFNGLYDHFFTSHWERFDNLDSLYYYYEADCDGGARPDGWEIQFFAIEKGKNPSHTIELGDLNVSQKRTFIFKSGESFDFSDSDISYYIINSEAEVTYRYFSGCQEFTTVGVQEYSGNVVIPRTATYHNYYNDTYTTYPVTSIGQCAFSLSLLDENNSNEIDSLNSVILPKSITSVGEEAFGNSPNLTFIKCLAVTPPSASNNSFDDGVYQNTTLYVPMGAMGAYRNATGWKNFLNIVGFYDYDFEVDGIYYKVTGDNDVMVVAGEDAYHGVVNIPNTVTHEGVTYDVTGIAGGAFADATLQSLIIPVTIGNIDEGAFTGCQIGSLVITGNGAWAGDAIDCSIGTLYVMSSVFGIPDLQVNPATIYSYATVPPTCNENTFTGYDAELHVPASALAAYFTAPYWNYFINIVGDAVEPTGLTVNKDSVDVLVGNQITLTAIPAPTNATPTDIIWTSSDESIATVANGIITGVKAGECDVKAYLLDKSAVCHVTVTEIVPTEVTLSQEFAKLEVGSQLTLTATVYPEDATDKIVTWSTTNSDVATVDDQGTVTAVGHGECFVTATCRDQQAMCHIIVVDHFIFITLDEHEVRLMPNHMFTLTPTVMPEGTDLVVTSTNPAVAAARMANGKIQVVGITEGRTVIKVNSTDGYAEADSCLVKVYTLRGDVNCDGFVNITDVTTLIYYLLTEDASSISAENADTNNDGKINISDVTKLISYLLGTEELDPKEEPIEGMETFTVNGVTFTMMPVEGGTFTMGATAEQGTSDPWSDERPVHEVTLSAFSIGQTEVTQALWQAVMGSNPSHFTGNLNRPVEMVSWEDCQTFITQLNQMTGRTFRLPTEAEWEYAARGGKQSQGYKYAGSNDVSEVAWWDTNACDGVGTDSPDYGTHAVATLQANELGLYDMSGNVWEWCQDWYDRYSSDPQTNPTGPATGTQRVYRGGSWLNYARNCRVSSRYHWTMDGADNIGLRLVLQ